ncbi:hypothetical protein O6H91_21G062500 [Diphasiastrum complanatum]|uniref:Uncharacterized protein n=1 Tax=Diphasiastrum complanatum TaxID=34168 RepID=A0ACC2ALF9_DIPCM|nr:hypothetical protein O6H91_21G062500 [Diphasiastrum complanatum]
MHGRPRKRGGGDGGASEQKEKAKIAFLEPLQAQVLQNHHNCCYTKEALQKNARLLELNPEVNTAWNYRKLALRHLIASEQDVEVHKALAREELRVIEMALARNYKSYGAWHHRKWVIGLGLSLLENEFRLLDKFMDADARNFHAWDYRRHVASVQGAALEKELEFTRKKIYDNFSNYSAWHKRSTLLSQLFKENGVDILKHSTLSSEFELVHQAFFTEPDDQSAWFYYNWLLDHAAAAPDPKLLSTWPSDAVLITIDEQSEPSQLLHFRGISGLEETILLEGVPIFLCFSKPVTGVSGLTVSVQSVPDSKQALHGLWKPVANKGGASNIWSADLNHFTDAKIKKRVYELSYNVRIEIGSTQGIISQDGHPFLGPVHLTFVLRSTFVGSYIVKDDIHGEQNLKIVEDDKWEPHPEQALAAQSLSMLEKVTWSEKLMKEEIGLCRELLELESSSKWATLTLARLLEVQQNISQDKRLTLRNNTAEVLQLYEKLTRIDPSHAEYYQDRHSLNLLDQITSDSAQLKERWSIGLHGSVLGRDIGILWLNGLSLSKLGYMERLLSLQMLDLSYNHLRALDGLEALQFLVHLNLSHNLVSCVHTLRPISKLQRLRSLDISHNKLTGNSYTGSGVSVAVCWDLSSKNRMATPSSHTFEYLNDIEDVFKCMNLEELAIAGNPGASDNQFRVSLLESLPSLKLLDCKSVP